VSDLDLDLVSRVARLKAIEEIKQLKARHATGKWRLLMPATTRVDGRNEARWLLGAYDDRYFCDNGVWLFEVMNLHVNLFAPHQGSWADTAVQ
jgi:hypothetical protein